MRQCAAAAVVVALGQSVSLLDTLSTLFVKLLAKRPHTPNVPVTQYVVTYWLICIVAFCWSVLSSRQCQRSKDARSQGWTELQQIEDAATAASGSTAVTTAGAVAAARNPLDSAAGGVAWKRRLTTTSGPEPLISVTTDITSVANIRDADSVTTDEEAGTFALYATPAKQQQAAVDGCLEISLSSASTSMEAGAGGRRSNNAANRRNGILPSGGVNAAVPSFPVLPSADAGDCGEIAATTASGSAVIASSPFVGYKRPRLVSLLPSGVAGTTASSRSSFQNWFSARTTSFYILLGFFDVQGGFMTVVAFRHTSLSSCCLIDWVSLLTTFFLSVQFTGEQCTRNKIVALVCGMLGSLCILYSDAATDIAEAAIVTTSGRLWTERFFGDVVCVGAAVFLGVVTVMMEAALTAGAAACEVLLKSFSAAAFIGLFQALMLERDEIWKLSLMDQVSWVYFVGAAVTMAAAYTVAPIVLERCGSAFFALSLLTSAGMALVLSSLLFGDAIEPLYIIGLGTIFVSLVIYHTGGTHKTP